MKSIGGWDERQLVGEKGENTTTNSRRSKEKLLRFLAGVHTIQRTNIMIIMPNKFGPIHNPARSGEPVASVWS